MSLQEIYYVAEMVVGAAIYLDSICGHGAAAKYLHNPKLVGGRRRNK